jgi:hypothetical protein
MIVLGILVFIAIAIIIVLMINHHEEFNSKETVKDGHFNLKYHIINDDDADKTAVIINDLNLFVIDVIDHLKVAIVENRIDDDHMYFVKNLVNKYNPMVVSEGNSDDSDTSFIINKGDKMVICVKNRNNEFHDMSLLKFVTLHEISHIGSIEYQHESEFWDNFRWLLRFVVKERMYEPIDYGKYPIEYCKHVYLQDNPYFS